MANFFEGVGNLLKHPIDEIKWMADETKGVVKPLLKGDVSESFDSFKGSFGRHNKMMEDITVPLGGHNKLTENPDAVAGTILGGIFAAPAIGGAFGGGSGGAASGSGFGGFGTEGAFSNYFKPSSITNPGLSSGGTGWQGGAQLDLGLPTDYAGMKKAATAEAGGFDWQGLAKTLQSIKPNDNTPPINMSRSGGGGGRYDKSVFENQMLTRELNSLYNQPLYQNLG